MRTQFLQETVPGYVTALSCVDDAPVLGSVQYGIEFQRGLHGA